MMKNILIVPFHYWGPIYGTLKLSKTLKLGGFNVIYVVPTEFSDFIKGQGFNCLVYELPVKSKKASKWRRILSNYINLRNRDNLLENYACHIIENTKPALVLVDSDIPRYAAVLQKYAKVVMYAVNPSNNKEDNIPPYFSDHIPSESLYSKIYVELFWKWWFFRKKLYFLKYEILSLGQFDYDLKNFYLKNKMDARHLNQERAWPTGFHNLQEIFLYPAAFDFGKKNSRINNHYIGPMVDIYRDKELAFEWSDIKQTAITICCMMGTMTDIYYPNINKFYNLLVQTIKGRLDITLILVAQNLKIKHANIYVYSKIPLSLVLDKCDVFITHGGFNSVKEAVLKAVPLLIVPISKQNDQRGVAARCVYHGIGRRLKLKDLSLESLSYNIQQLLDNKIYKKNAKYLSKNFEDSEWSNEKVLNFINSQIDDSTILFCEN